MWHVLTGLLFDGLFAAIATYTTCSVGGLACPDFGVFAASLAFVGGGGLLAGNLPNTAPHIIGANSV